MHTPMIDRIAVRRHGQDAMGCLQSVQPDRQPMKSVFSLALIAATIISGAAGAFACEKHLNGHQNSSDSNTEGARK